MASFPSDIPWGVSRATCNLKDCVIGPDQIGWRDCAARLHPAAFGDAAPALPGEPVGAFDDSYGPDSPRSPVAFIVAICVAPWAHPLAWEKVAQLAHRGEPVSLESPWDSWAIELGAAKGDGRRWVVNADTGRLYGPVTEPHGLEEFIPCREDTVGCDPLTCIIPAVIGGAGPIDSAGMRLPSRPTSPWGRLIANMGLGHIWCHERLDSDDPSVLGAQSWLDDTRAIWHHPGAVTAATSPRRPTTVPIIADLVKRMEDDEAKEDWLWTISLFMHEHIRLASRYGGRGVLRELARTPFATNAVGQVVHTPLLKLLHLAVVNRAAGEEEWEQGVDSMTVFPKFIASVKAGPAKATPSRAVTPSDEPVPSRRPMLRNAFADPPHPSPNPYVMKTRAPPLSGKPAVILRLAGKEAERACREAHVRLVVTPVNTSGLKKMASSHQHPDHLNSLVRACFEAGMNVNKKELDDVAAVKSVVVVGHIKENAKTNATRPQLRVMTLHMTHSTDYPEMAIEEAARAGRYYANASGLWIHITGAASTLGAAIIERLDAGYACVTTDDGTDGPVCPDIGPPPKGAGQPAPGSWRALGHCKSTPSGDVTWRLPDECNHEKNAQARARRLGQTARKQAEAYGSASSSAMPAALVGESQLNVRTGTTTVEPTLEGFFAKQKRKAREQKAAKDNAGKSKDIAREARQCGAVATKANSRRS